MERISKIMASRGMCSRREADSYIEAGLVKVNGEIISALGSKAPLDAEIILLPKARKAQEDKITIMLNKPLGIVSTQPEDGYAEAKELITADNQVGDGPEFAKKHLKKLAVVGRLDIDSKGLLLLTQDGTIAKQVIGPEATVEKEYIVSIQGEIDDKILSKLRFGLELDGKPLKRAKVDRIEHDLLRIVLVEGKKRQIRRMCELVGLRVIKLKRVRIGKLRLSDLPEGKWRFVLPHEMIVA